MKTLTNTSTLAILAADQEMNWSLIVACFPPQEVINEMDQEDEFSAWEYESYLESQADYYNDQMA